MPKALTVAAALLALVGCTTAHPTPLPGGGQGFMIGCGGVQHTMIDCFARAGQVCPDGYDVVTASAESTPIINPYERSILVRCR